MSILSTVHRGTQFEHRCLAAASKYLGIHTRRVGGKNDGGIDLIGWWSLPHQRIRIIAQCKAEKKKTGPKYIRELEGVLSRYQPLEEEQEVTGIAAVLFSSSEFTKEAKLRALSSTKPFCLIHLPSALGLECTETLGSVIWNTPLSQLLGDVELRQELGGDESGRLALWHAGERLQIHPK